MARKALWVLAGLILPVSCALAAASPWGSLKKIYFYEAGRNSQEVRRNLQLLDAQDLTPDDRLDLLGKLVALGDRYWLRNDASLAEAFYRKALAVSPQDAWPVYNKLERISRHNGRLTWDPGNVWRQFRLVTKSFSGSFLLLNGTFDVLMFSGLLLFFVVTVALAIRYFKLAAHDFILEARSRFSLLKLLLLLLLLLWPLAITGGWGFYPFLLCGFLWGYFTHDERVNVKRILGLLLGLAFVFSLGQYLEKSLRSEGFQTIRRVHSGQLYPDSAFSRFDNEMKVMQATAYYYRGRPDSAMEALQETGGQYASTLKFNLLGNIYFEKGNFPQSIQYYRQSLSLDDRNPLTLKNFTLALLRNNDPDLFLLYSKSYPRINELKDTVTSLQKDRLPERILWRRLLNFSWRTFHPWYFLEVVLGGFVTFPALLALLVLAVYATLLRKLAPALGQSVFCSKCAKIIRKMSIEQAQSHALCEDCYQLFLIKDPIFLEAKMLKERDIHRQFRLKKSLLLAASLLIPGFILNFQGKSRVFTPLFFACFTVFALFLFTALNFKAVFGTVPMFVNLIGVAAALLYLAVNIYAIQGDVDGF